jgi:hypothetical protein
MDPRPVPRTPIPAYPTRLQILEDPSLLERHLPPAWRRHAELAAAATVFLAVNVAGHGQSAETEDPDAPPPAAPATPPAVVAPIFEHGDGRGATGCVVVAPPVFLSEEEALQVISEELGKHGITLGEHEVTLPDVTIPPRHRKDFDGDEVVEELTRARPLELDARSTEPRVALEFVSREEYFELGGVDFPPNSFSSVRSYDTREVAQRLAEQVQAQGEGMYFGAFYDPMVKITREEGAQEDVTWEELQKRTRERARTQLREQVQDFVEWLQGQGVI